MGKMIECDCVLHLLNIRETQNEITNVTYITCCCPSDNSLHVCCFHPVRYKCRTDGEVLNGGSPENGTIRCNELEEVLTYQADNILQPADCELVFSLQHMGSCRHACVYTCMYCSVVVITGVSQ